MNPETILPCPHCGAPGHIEKRGDLARCSQWAQNGCASEWIRLTAWNRRPQADWSAAAREIIPAVHNSWQEAVDSGKTVGEADAIQLAAIESIIRKRAQSQPSAPSPVPSQETQAVAWAYAPNVLFGEQDFEEDDFSRDRPVGEDWIPLYRSSVEFVPVSELEKLVEYWAVWSQHFSSEEVSIIKKCRSALVSVIKARVAKL